MKDHKLPFKKKRPQGGATEWNIYLCYLFENKHKYPNLSEVLSNKHN